MKKKLLIVDGHNLLFQMFYGMPNKIYNKIGDPIHGTIGFIGGLIKIINLNSPDYVLVLFDSEHDLERRNINKQYKTNRTDYTNALKDENPFYQLNHIYCVLDEMKIKYIEVENIETDDIIASYCFEYQDKYNIIISSFDTDFFSLINKNVSIFKYKGKNSKIVDEIFIKDIYDIDAKYFADYKSLIGDNADNIVGIRGVGPKTASKLINNYGPVENIIKNINDIGNLKLKREMENNIERLLQNKTLIQFNKKHDIPFNIGELRYKLSNDIKTMKLLEETGVL